MLLTRKIKCPAKLPSGDVCGAFIVEIANSRTVVVKCQKCGKNVELRNRDTRKKRQKDEQVVPASA